MTAHLCFLNPFPVLLLHRRSSNQILFAFPLKLNILYLPNEGFLLRQLCSATKAHELFLVFHCRRLTLDFVSSHTLLKRSHRHGRRPKSGWRRWKTEHGGVTTTTQFSGLVVIPLSCWSPVANVKSSRILIIPVVRSGLRVRSS